MPPSSLLRRGYVVVIIVGVEEKEEKEESAKRDDDDNNNNSANDDDDGGHVRASSSVVSEITSRTCSSWLRARPITTTTAIGRKSKYHSKRRNYISRIVANHVEKLLHFLATMFLS